MTKPAPHDRYLEETDDHDTLLSAKRFVRIFRELGDPFAVRRIPVRSSGIHCLRECPRKFLFRYRCGLRLKGERAFALDVGTVFHNIMAHLHYVGPPHDIDTALAATSTWVQEKSVGFQALADDTGLMPDGTPIEKLIQETERSYSLARVMAQVSVDYLFGGVFKGWKPFLIEQPIEVKLDEITAPVRCKPDIVLQSEENPADLMLVDHKTCSGNSAQRAAVVLYETQPALERLVAEAAFPEHTVKFFVHNIVVKTGLRYPAKKYPTWEDYLTAVRDDYEARLTKDPDNPPFLQALTATIGAILPRELFTNLTEASAACQGNPDPSRYYRNSSACFGRFGRSPCPYLELCRSGAHLWPEILERRFTTSFREDDEEADTLLAAPAGKETAQ